MDALNIARNNVKAEKNTSRATEESVESPRYFSINETNGLGKRQPWMEFIQIPSMQQGGEETWGLRNSDETRLFEECDDKRLGG